MGSNVYALTVDRSGNMYAGGWLTTAGGVASGHIAEYQPCSSGAAESDGGCQVVRPAQPGSGWWLLVPAILALPLVKRPSPLEAEKKANAVSRQGLNLPSRSQHKAARYAAATLCGRISAAIFRAVGKVLRSYVV